MSEPWTTLEMAKKQVGIDLTDSALDDLLRMYLRIAEAMCLNFAQNDVLPVLTAPDDEISGAIYLQFAELWRFRGDDVDKDPPQSFIPGAPSVQVCRILLKRRAPSIA